MRRTMIFAAILAAFLVGCGGSPSSPRPSQPASLVNGHPCSPSDEALQCVLPPASFKLGFAPSRPVAQGVDFAWGAPSVAQMRALGAKFGASYFSFDPSKGWTQRAGLVSEYHRAGIATVGVWETSAVRAAEGCAAGRADAYAARAQAAAVGNTTRPIDFAIDFDAEGAQVDSYFRCGHAILGARESAYGGYYPLKYLCAHGLVGQTNWQTYAWSGGRWLPSSCAPLEQFLNGSSVDYDRALVPDYGQWAAPAHKPPETSTQRRARERKEVTGHKAVLGSYRPALGLRGQIVHLRTKLLRDGCDRRVKHHERTGLRCKGWHAAEERVSKHGRYEDRKIRELAKELR